MTRKKRSPKRKNVDAQLKSDLDIFFGGEFANIARYCPQNDDCREVSIVVFLEPSDLGDSFFYRFGGKASDFPELAKGDKFELDNEIYGVTDFVIDEYGLTIEILANKEGQR